MSRKKIGRHLLLFAGTGFILAASSQAPDGIAVTIRPEPCLIERSATAQLVNCDLLLSNSTESDWTLDEVQVSVIDRAGALAWRKLLNSNGSNPSIGTVPQRTIEAGKKILLFAPLYEFPLSLDLAELKYTLTFRGKERQQLRVDAAARPVAYSNHVRLRLPLPGRFIVWDGHDFLAHHRRWDYLLPAIQEFGFDSNAGRYAYDFVPVDRKGEMYAGPEEKNESWFGFGTPILAPAAGKVVAVIDSYPDDHEIDFAALKKDLLAEFGNYIVIDHGRGEFSLFGHIRQKSARVKVGDSVRAGQPIAAIGASGSSLFPHLHYQLQNAASGHAEGLPSYFADFDRVLGSRTSRVRYGQVDSGDILENNLPKR